MESNKEKNIKPMTDEPVQSSSNTASESTKATDVKDTKVKAVNTGASSLNEDQSIDAAESKWIRLLYMILFLFIFGIAEAVLYINTLSCFVTHVVQSKPSPQAVAFGENLALYASRIISYLTYSKQSPPWPFESWENTTQR